MSSFITIHSSNYNAITILTITSTRTSTVIGTRRSTQSCEMSNLFHRENTEINLHPLQKQAERLDGDICGGTYKGGFSSQKQLTLRKEKTIAKKQIRQFYTEAQVYLKTGSQRMNCWSLLEALSTEGDFLRSSSPPKKCSRKKPAS